jgi:hypothetical protein
MKVYLAGMKDATVYRMGSRLLRVALKLLGKQSRPFRVPGWTETRDFPPLADKSFKTLWKETQQQSRLQTTNRHK